MTEEQEFKLTKPYEGPQFPNNDFALALYEKIYGKSKSKDKTNDVNSANQQSANLAQSTNWCFQSPIMSWTKQVCKSHLGELS